MKKILFAIPVLVLVAAGCSSAPAATVKAPAITVSASPTPTAQANNSKTYSNAALGFSIQYPTSWSIDTQRSSASEVVFNNGSPESHISISVKPYTGTVASWESSLDQSVITQTKKVSVAGQPGIESYSGEVGGLSGEIGVVYKGNLYVFDEADSMPAGMLSSFMFTN